MNAVETWSPHVWGSYLVTDRGATPHDRAWDAVLARVPLLSEREFDVFQLLAKGASNRTIAVRLAITERTAKAHVAQILAKLDVESRLQAGIVGFAWGTLSRGGGGEPPGVLAPSRASPFGSPPDQRPIPDRPACHGPYPPPVPPAPRPAAGRLVRES
ncbi:helix-turn-helix transcriptional regulator [Streptomyces sp. NPDC002054]|uniref:helix-turn-helix domain-containing protein n=1 Tax=Streptomyces sp. NPDC002054 TaxID=3154663 RepID=UPI003331A000